MLFDWLSAPAAPDPAQRIYGQVIAQARMPFFYRTCGVKDSVDGRFDMIALHLFLVLNFLRHEPGARKLSRDLMETFIDDMDANLREMGAGDLGVGRRVRVMAEALRGRLEAYLDAFAQGEESLSATIAKNVYRGAFVAPDMVSALLTYFYQQSDYLGRQSVSWVMEGDVRFAPPLARAHV